MIGAAKRKSISPPGLSALWSILLLVVALCLPETRVWGFATTPQPASGVFESASPSSVAEFTTATAYDASDSSVAARVTPVKYIGRLDDLQGIPRNQTLLDDLPDLGSPRANYYQNSSVLRKALRDGFEIRDASAFRPNSELAPTLLRPDRTVGQTFLGAERLILDNKGLQLSPSGAYVPR
jgi:hypothetical protein